MLKYILLGFLQEETRTGYDIKALLEQSTTHFWHAYHSQIYTTLRKLEQEGLLSSTTTDETPMGKRTYAITPAGTAELDKWLAQSMTRIPPSKHELLVRLFFSARRDKAAVLDELRIQRRLHEAALEAYDHIPSEHWGPHFDADHIPTPPFYWYATLDFGFRYERMYLEWLDDLIAQLEAE